MDWRFDLTSTNNNINGYEVEALPVPRIDINTQFDKRSQLGEQARVLYEFYISKNEQKHLLEFIDLCLSQIPKQYDVVHDMLTYLTEMMIESNQQKQAEMKRFIVWLEGEIGTLLDNLSGKSSLQNFLGDYQKSEAHLKPDQLLAILVKNKRCLEVDPSERAFRQAFERRYQQALDVLLPIKRKLELTDRLIDQVVYKLYGLTEDEIAVVEGRG